MTNYCFSGFLIPVNIQLTIAMVKRKMFSFFKLLCCMLQRNDTEMDLKRIGSGRSVRRKANRFKIINGELLYIKKDKKEVNIKYFSNTFILSNNATNATHGVI